MLKRVINKSESNDQEHMCFFLFSNHFLGVLFAILKLRNKHGIVQMDVT